MGAFKDSIQGDGRGYGGGSYREGGKGEWPDVSPHRRCPVCGAGSWCQVKRDGTVVLCKRDAGGREKENSRGEVFYVHVMHGVDPRTVLPPLPPSVARAPADDLDRAYQMMLDALPLDRSDRAGLRARGLTDEAITANGYATLPLEGRARFAREVIGRVGEDTARAVPGIVWKEDEARGRGWWSVGGSPGLLIPVRDLLGRIVALKVRRREVDPGQQRYLYLSSATRGGASADNALHVPRAARAGVGARLVITEGELKADVATHLLAPDGWVAVSIPGVGAWRAGLAFAVEAGAQEVAVALDMDAASNPIVRGARDELVQALRARVRKVSLWKWDARWKGLDDYLARPRVQETA